MRANSRSLPRYLRPSMAAFLWPTRGCGNRVGTKHDDLWRPIQGHFRVTQDQVWPPFCGQLEVMVTSRGPSMTITEIQLEAIAAPSETKHDDLWWPIRGRDEFVGTKHDRLWRSTHRARSSCKGTGWAVAGVVGSLLRGCDTSSFVSAFAKAVVSLFKDTWCLGKWTPIQIWRL